MTGQEAGGKPAGEPGVAPAGSKSSVVEQPEAKASLFAAYDLTLLKFVGGVADTKAKVRGQQAYKDTEKAGHDLEIREV